MAEFHLEFLPAAVEDLDRVSAYYLHLAGAASAERITDQILTALERLTQFPYLGPLHQDPVLAAMGFRKLVAGEYVRVYKVIDQTVFVYRIVHGTRDYPKYFYERLELY